MDLAGWGEADGRRARVRRSGLNGIDWVEVSDDQLTLTVRFLRPVPARAYGLPRDPSRVAIEPLGGSLGAKPVRVAAVRRLDRREVAVDVAEPGGFSTYRLTIRSESLDPVFAAVDFSFKAGCPNRFDCRPVEVAASARRTPEPEIDYMAKDFASLRRALLDRLPQVAPGWTERNPADAGIAIIELIAYLGDRLSYMQDAVANEAYLETSRQRESVRRHARLVDYRMHDGLSARAFVHVEVDGAGTLPAGATLLTRVGLKNVGDPGAVVPMTRRDEALDAAEAVFETILPARLDERMNDVPLHDWDGARCALPEGATSADLARDLRGAVAKGDFLLLEEALGPRTGLPQDADPRRRQVVRLTDVHHTRDPLLGVPIARVSWSEEDALRFPLLISTRDRDGRLLEGVSRARGNLALADHGRSWPAEARPGPEPPPRGGRRRAHRVRLGRGPLSIRAPVGDGSSAAAILAADPRDGFPQVDVAVVPSPPTQGAWTAAKDLLASDGFDARFVVEPDRDGRPTLRFGDDTHGLAPPDGSTIVATYRTGVGVRGNVPASAIAHVVEQPGLPAIRSVRNALPASGGVDPEPLARVKERAPQSLRADVGFAVTEDDFARAAEKHPLVAKAEATFRWTGSWHTVFVTVDPRGRGDLSPDLARSVKAHLGRYLQAGYDLEVDAPRYVPVDLALVVCARRGHFRSDVERAVLEALSTRDLADGRRGFFHPDAFTFGEPLRLSRLVATVEEVEGVESLRVVSVKRHGKAPAGELAAARLDVGRLEIVRCDNDPDRPGNGRVEVAMEGGA